MPSRANVLSSVLAKRFGRDFDTGIRSRFFRGLDFAGPEGDPVTASVHVPSARAAAVRDQSGGRPLAVAAFPGAAGAREAVFEVGSGIHEFTGPGLIMPGSR